MQNAGIASGAARPVESLSRLAVCGLVLMVSVPFAYFHSVEGWINARRHAIATYLSARRDKEVWKIAQQLHVRHTEEAHAAAVRRHQAEEEARAARNRRREEEYERERQAYEELRAAWSVVAAAQDSPARSSDAALHPLPSATLPEDPAANAEVLSSEARATYTVEPLDAAPVRNGGLNHEALNHEARNEEVSPMPEGLTAGIRFAHRPGLRPIPTGPSPAQRMEIARRDERAREAYARIRDLSARRTAALVWHESRIADLESQRRNENAEPVLQASYRLEDAYHEFIGAVKTFDAEYLKEIVRVERLRRGGVFSWLFRSLFRRPAAEYDDSEAI
jgi:hypothetical protein